MDIRAYKTTKITALVVVLLILTAMLCRQLDGWIPAVIRALIYICMFVMWGISLRQRIIQSQVRRYLTGIAALIVFWILVRCIKFRFATEPVELRYLWYAYYFAIVLIPLLAVFVAVSLGKPENYKLGGGAYLLFIPAIVLIIMVLANDAHQLVFTFDGDKSTWSDEEYGYGIFYWVIAGWGMLCSIAAFVTIIIKCRVSHSRNRFWLPLIPLIITIIYVALYAGGYVTRGHLIHFFAGDITITISLLVALIFECCIWSGLIQSNSHYREFVSVSTVEAQVTDEEFNIYYSYRNLIPMEKATLEKAVETPVILENGMRLSSKKIRGGYVFWQDDISDVLEVIDSLSQTNEELMAYGTLLEEERRQKARRKKVEEQDRLFDEIEKKISPQVSRLSELIEELKQCETEESARKTLGKIDVIGSCVKRCSNLLFLANQSANADSKELELCLRESVDNLTLFGVHCAYKTNFQGEMPVSIIQLLYEFYTGLVIQVIDKLTYCLGTFEKDENSYIVSVILQCEDLVPVIEEEFYGAEVTQDEDGLWYCRYKIMEGGYK